jgi:nitrite reductase/ring-hydroxylating ferredoxin subunit
MPNGGDEEATVADEGNEPAGPDLTGGIALAELAEGKPLVGHVGGEEVLLVRRGAEVFAIGASCTHYHGPLAEGLVVGDTVRCPWHHACFDLRNGRMLRVPALSDLPCWVVERRSGKIFVRGKRPTVERTEFTAGAAGPDRIVIIGGGAAGFVAADALRRAHYQRSIVMLSSDTAPPVDRPNLSKDFLAGTAPEDWVPLRPDNYYAENGIDLRLNVEVAEIDVRAREVVLSDSSTRYLTTGC